MNLIIILVFELKYNLFKNILLKQSCITETYAVSLSEPGRRGGQRLTAMMQIRSLSYNHYQL